MADCPNGLIDDASLPPTWIGVHEFLNWCGLATVLEQPANAVARNTVHKLLSGRGKFQECLRKGYVAAEGRLHKWTGRPNDYTYPPARPNNGKPSSSIEAAYWESALIDPIDVFQRDQDQVPTKPLDGSGETNRRGDVYTLLRFNSRQLKEFIPQGYGLVLQATVRLQHCIHLISDSRHDIIRSVMRPWPKRIEETTPRLWHDSRAHKALVDAADVCEDKIRSLFRDGNDQKRSYEAHLTEQDGAEVTAALEQLSAALNSVQPLAASGKTIDDRRRKSSLITEWWDSYPKEQLRRDSNGRLKRGEKSRILRECASYANCSITHVRQTIGEDLS